MGAKYCQTQVFVSKRLAKSAWWMQMALSAALAVRPLRLDGSSPALPVF